MDATFKSKFLLLLTLLSSIRAKDSNEITESDNNITDSSIAEQQFSSTVIPYLQALKETSVILQQSLNRTDHKFNLPKPLKQFNTYYDYDDNDSRTRNGTDKDQSRRVKQQKSNGPDEARLKAALNVAAKQGLDAMIRLYEKTEPDLLKRGQFLSPNHPGAQLSKFSEGAIGTENNAKAAYAALIATKYFQKTYKLRQDDLGRQAPPPKVSFRRTPLEGLCPPREPPRCLPAAHRYRTHDGTCNNMKRPRWGSAFLPFNRFLPPEYGDGIDSLRGSIEGGPLSSARFVSLLVHGSRESQAPVTLMIAQWGQLVDHDLTSTAQPRSVNGSIPRCCGSDDMHPSCLPIKVPLDDPWLAPLKVRCLEFLRSAPAQRRDCVLSWREQTNQATSFLDASPVYSSNARNSDAARVFRNGLLQFGRGNPEDDVCLRGALSDHCIRPGDGRSGEQPGLLAMHHIWVGEHNRIALELSEMNPHWSDEKLYQEARRIVSALFQHITYREFLPLVVGRDVCKLFDLELLGSGYYDGYDPDINPTVANSFAAAAFRFGHSLIQNTYMRCDKNHNFLDNNVPLHDETTKGDMGSAGSLHRLLRGLAAQRAQMRDEFITAELTNHLFQSGSFPFGLDLAAINIQRGRDHGIPPYTSWREPCGLTPIRTWEDFENVVGPASANRISHAYRSVHDIDLFVGGIAERPVTGGLVGPTLACIIAQQFSNLRKGDRFWYENPNFENSFTPAQLHSIRRVSLAQILCRTLNGGTLQPHIFLPPDVTGNERIPCGTDLLASINLLPWLEADPFDGSIQASFSSSSEAPQSLPTPIFNRVVDLIPNSSTGLKQRPMLQQQQQIIRPTQHGQMNSIERKKIRPINEGQIQPITKGQIRPLDPLRNITKIHNKLDLRFPPRFTSTSTLPPKVIRTKIDTKKRKTSITKTRQPTGTLPNKKFGDFTTRRTVIINNIPLIVRRNVDPFSTDQQKIETRSDDMDLGDATDSRTYGSEHDPIHVQINRLNSTQQHRRTNRTKTNDLTETQRHYNEEITYGTNKEQKLFIPGPDTEEYEIEINIRQTNTRRPSGGGSSQFYQKHPSKYDDFNSISTPFSYKQTTSRPTYGQFSDYRTSTKPSKIIYIDDTDDYTTTAAPGLLQTFFMVGTNSILEHFQQKPNTFFQNNQLFGGSGTNANKITSSSLSSGGSNSASNSPISQNTGLNGGIAATPSSNSNSNVNNFVNINIRPTGHNYDLQDSSFSNPGSYGFLADPRRPSALHKSKPGNPFSTNYPSYHSTHSFHSSPSYQSSSSYQSSPHRDYNNYYRLTSTTKRPYYRPSNYYPRTKDTQLTAKPSKIDLEPMDYDARTYLPILLDSSNDNDTETTDEYYDYDDVDNETLAMTFDQDGYLRPEHMLFKIMTHKTINDKDTTLTNETTYENDTNEGNSEDDFVLPLLLETEAETKPLALISETSLYDAIPRRPATEILAEDYDEVLTRKPHRTIHTNSNPPLVPFAPLNILTKPERPDKWVIYDEPKEQNPLPTPPQLDTGNFSSTEFPKPILMSIQHNVQNKSRSKFDP